MVLLFTGMVDQPYAIQQIKRHEAEMRKLQTINVMNEREAAQYIGMSPSFLRQGRMDGNRKGRTPTPPYLQIGRSIRYLCDDLDKWLIRHRQGDECEL